MGALIRRRRSEAVTPRRAREARERAPAWSSSTIALVATPQTARAAVPFLSVLGLGRSVVSWQQLRAEGGRPDAFVATRVELVPGLAGAPVAVFVKDRASLRAAARRGVEVALTTDQRLLDHGAVLVPRAGVDVARWTMRTTEERAEARRELGLPDELAIGVDHPHVTDDVLAALSLAAAAVVTGPMVPLALALGTPVVTSPVSAERLGLHPDLEVEVVAGRQRADAAARALAADPERAAELSRRARRFAEHHLDLGHPAAVVARRLGLPPAEGLPDRPSTEAAAPELAPLSPDRFRFEWPDDTSPTPPIVPDDIFGPRADPPSAVTEDDRATSAEAAPREPSFAPSMVAPSLFAQPTFTPPTFATQTSDRQPVRGSAADVPPVLRPATIDLVARRSTPTR